MLCRAVDKGCGGWGLVVRWFQLQSCLQVNERCILLQFQEINNSIQFQYQMIQEQALKQCRQILKKNNLHPLKKLGKGAFSFVFSVEKIQLKSPDNEVYSVKCINKKQFSKKPYLVKYIEQEIQSMREVSHHNIVKLIRTFQDQGWIFLIMEYCDKGNIYSAQSLKENGLFELNECIFIVKNVLNGLNHIHSKNLIHRDIKAENILLISDPNKKEPYGFVTKICDLGFCREDDDNVNTFCGTTSYMAPEIFKKNIYCNKVDIWAVGVLMYKMLFGDFPFKSINMEYEINSKCNKGFNLKKMKVKQNASINKEKFQILAECFNRIFTIDPNERISIDQLKKFHFFESEKKFLTMKTLPSTESDSGGDEQSTFQLQKLLFVQEILQEVKKIKFLSSWQQICFQYYLKKIQLTLVQPVAKGNQEYTKKIKELQKAIANLEASIDANLKKINIPKFVDYYTPQTSSFADYKEPYRLVVGYVFSKAHKSINDNTTLRSQVKIQLFCCHLINRIFEKQYRNEIFTHYFDWLKTQKKQKKFLFQSFKQWIKQQNPQKLVQTVETMNDKFYRKK